MNELFSLCDDREVAVETGFDAGVEIVPLIGICGSPVSESAPTGGVLAEQQIVFAVAVVIADCFNAEAVARSSDPVSGC